MSASPWFTRLESHFRHRRLLATKYMYMWGSAVTVHKKCVYDELGCLENWEYVVANNEHIHQSIREKLIRMESFLGEELITSIVYCATKEFYLSMESISKQKVNFRRLLYSDPRRTHFPEYDWSWKITIYVVLCRCGNLRLHIHRSTG